MIVTKNTNTHALIFFRVTVVSNIFLREGEKVKHGERK